MSYKTDEHKTLFLKSLFEETYIKDIKERYNIRKDDDLEELINTLASGIGALTNPNKLSNTFKSEKKSVVSYDTIKDYIEYLCDSFLVEKSTRYDVKGKKYINSPNKYYFMDLGLRNARLNFRQNEKTHLMENLIYNELRIRGYNVDVGSVEIREGDSKKQLEIDFVANKGSKKYYVQSALTVAEEEKREQEIHSLTRVGDSFKKIVVVKDSILP